MFTTDAPGWNHVNVDVPITTSAPFLRYDQAMSLSTLNTTLVSIGLLGLSIGCTGSNQQPDIVLDGDDFFGAPWPEDSRTTNGKPDMSNFPRRGEVSLVEQYLVAIEQLDGFGTNAPIYIPLSEEPDSFPSPADTSTTDGSILLIDIDPNSPERGRIVPVTVHFQKEETQWQRGNLLSIQPVWGFPLRPRTTHALVLSTDFVNLVTDWREYRDWRDLDSTLLQLHIDSDHIAHVVQFTTQDPVGEMAKFKARISNDLTLPALDQPIRRFHHANGVSGYEGTMWVPMWQHGTKPYLTSGGGFVFDSEGMPVLQQWEKVHFAMSVPEGMDPPADGWPVVIYGHGTGGTHRGFVQSNNELSPGKVLAEAGLIGFGISLPLHGDRGTSIDPALVSFNYLNPESARAVFRQGALDQVYLAELLTTRIHAFEMPDGSVLQTDPDRVAYMGHSHGGLIGAIATPFFGDRLAAVFLSGAGGGLSTTVVSRDAGDFDIQEILQSTLDFGEHDELIESHPIIAMVQTLAETTDPINYAPYWHHRKPFWDGVPTSVLMTEGLNDLQTPPDTAEALAASGMLPLLSPVAHISTAHRLIGGGSQRTPAQGNQTAWDGSKVSVGLAQYADASHFAIFEDADAAELYQHFLSSALNGELPEIQEL
jgi:pimeloyl-ACP methyl ester carboxylesterase